MSDKYTPGQDCGCYAYSESECGCGADWTPSEVYELREQLAAEHCRQLFSLADQLATERALADRLAEAANEVIAQWQTPNWKLTESTAIYMNKLMNTLAAWKEARSE